MALRKPSLALCDGQAPPLQVVNDGFVFDRSLSQLYALLTPSFFSYFIGCDVAVEGSISGAAKP